MLIKLFLSGSMYKSNVRPGVYPKWSSTHLRIWCIARTENTVLLTLRVTYRSAPLMAFVLRQLGARIGRNLHCAQDASLSGPLDLLSAGDNIAIQTGAYLHTTRWSGQYLCVGPIHLESGCKIGMRAAVGPDVKIGHGSWITPFTAILSDVGAQEIWEGAPARRTGRCTELERTKDTCRLSTPIPLLEAGNVLIQLFASFWLVIAPTAAVLWFATALFPGADADISLEYFRTTPLSEIIAELALYAFITGWLTILVTSVLGCLFVRWSAVGTGLIPTHGLRAALLMYRMQLLNRVQGQWTWTLTGQYLRALAGMRFPRLGASECDVMFNLVPELASADSQVFWSNGCFTNMLDYGARHIIVRHIDMPRDFFSGNNCVAEHGQFPSNFLLGASTPASDIQFRRQMRSRLGNPITVAGNPPVKFASASLETATEQERLPGFSLLLVRLFLFDLMGIGVLPITEALIFTIAYVCLLRLDSAHATAIAIIALLLTEVALILWSIGLKQWLVGRKWGMDHAAPFWSWRHFAYFFTQDCFFTWCRGSLGFFAGTLLANPVLRWMGCGIGRRTIVTQPMQCADWNAVRIGKDCVMDGILQLHSFENMMLKVKRSEIEDGCAVGFGSTVMGGAHIGRETTLLPLSLVLKEMSLPTAIYHGSPVEPINLDGQAHACPTSNA
jgi:non-ribosomal peptide synthetase-like protein